MLCLLSGSPGFNCWISFTPPFSCKYIVDSLYLFYLLFISPFVFMRLFICALWSPAGKGLTSWLSFVMSTVSLSLSHWYPWSGVVLDCIDS